MIRVKKGYKKEFIMDMGVILSLLGKMIHKYKNIVDCNTMRKVEEAYRIVKEVMDG